MKIAYFSPDRKEVFIEPDEDQLTRLIMETEYNYWMRGGNDGDGEMKYIVDEPPMSKTDVLAHEFGAESDYYIMQGYKILSKQPRLSILRPHKDYFSFHVYGDRVLAPYKGFHTEEYVTTEVGGDPYRIPFCCLVDKSVALQIVIDFCIKRKLSSKVEWKPISEIKFKADWFDDNFI